MRFLNTSYALLKKNFNPATFTIVKISIMKALRNHLAVCLLIIGGVLLAKAQEKTYYDNGKIKSEGKLKKEQKVGEWKYYYESGGLQRVEEYDKKSPNMFTTTYYYPSGKKKATGTWINNKMYNDWEWFYENGNLSSKGKYNNGEPLGPLEFYHENGNLKERGRIINKQREGEWELYYESGKLESKGSYSKSKQQGIWENYYENGNLKLKGNYENGLAHGEFDHYNEDGSILYTDYIGPEEKEDYFVPKEDKLPQSRSDRTIKTLYTTGQTKLAGTYDSPTMTWVLNWYFIDGQLKQTGAYKKNEPTGVWKTFYTNGALHSEAKYSAYGPRDQVFYHKNGNVKQKHENGATFTYYESGELKLKEFRTLGVVTSREYYKKDGTLIKKE